MSKKKSTPGGRAKKKAEVSLVRSSAAEYLTFVAASGQGGVEAVYADENVWLSQKMMGVLYDVETHTVNYHLKKVFADNELQEDSVLRNFRITAADGKTYDTQHYNLSAIIAVGYKVNSERAVQGRAVGGGIDPAGSRVGAVARRRGRGAGSDGGGLRVDRSQSRVVANAPTVPGGAVARRRGLGGRAWITPKEETPVPVCRKRPRKEVRGAHSIIHEWRLRHKHEPGLF